MSSSENLSNLNDQPKNIWGYYGKPFIPPLITDSPQGDILSRPPTYLETELKLPSHLSILYKAFFELYDIQPQELFENLYNNEQNCGFLLFRGKVVLAVANMLPQLGADLQVPTSETQSITVEIADDEKNAVPSDPLVYSLLSISLQEDVIKQSTISSKLNYVRKNIYDIFKFHKLPLEHQKYRAKNIYSLTIFQPDIAQLLIERSPLSMKLLQDLFMICEHDGTSHVLVKTGIGSKNPVSYAIVDNLNKQTVDLDVYAGEEFIPTVYEIFSGRLHYELWQKIFHNKPEVQKSIMNKCQLFFRELEDKFPINNGNDNLHHIKIANYYLDMLGRIIPLDDPIFRSIKDKYKCFGDRPDNLYCKLLQNTDRFEIEFLHNRKHMSCFFTVKEILSVTQKVARKFRNLNQNNFSTKETKAVDEFTNQKWFELSQIYLGSHFKI